MVKEDNKQKPSLLSGIELIKQREQWLEQAWALFCSNPESYGSTETPTKEGFIALAKLGKDVWNSWSERYPEPTPDFSSIDFREISIDFSKFSFPSKLNEGPCVNFSHSIFGNSTKFIGTEFGHKANFSHAIFGEFALFYIANFGNETNFRAALFGDAPYFAKAKFGNFGNFDGTVFGMAANFDEVIFGDHTTFKGTSFSGWADFSASTENHEEPERTRFRSISFAGANFHDSVNFTGRTFESTTDFGRLEKIIELPTTLHATGGERSLKVGMPTRFKGIPNFHGCKFHQDTNLDGAEFMAPPSPDAARAYRTLKLAMEQLKATSEEQKFFRLEMKAEHTNLPWGKRWVSTLYGLFSDYGFSLWRPAIALLVFSILFGVGYGLLTDACASDQGCIQAAITTKATSSSDITSDLLKYTLASIAPVPGLDKMQTELRAPLFGQHGWIAVAAIVLEIFHKIVALLMTFLFALALRNLFKMKS